MINREEIEAIQEEYAKHPKDAVLLYAEFDMASGEPFKSACFGNPRMILMALGHLICDVVDNGYPGSDIELLEELETMVMINRASRLKGEL